MKQQTAVEWLLENIQKVDKMDWDLVFMHAILMEKKQIEKAMMHSLDEDGHTGEWKIKFIEQYYEETYK